MDFHSQRLRDALLFVTRPYLISPRLCTIAARQTLLTALRRDERPQTAWNFYEGANRNPAEGSGRFSLSLSLSLSL